MAGHADPKDPRGEADRHGGDASRLLTPAEVMAVPATGDPGWRGRAACTGGVHDPELWWPYPSEPAVEARAICAGCPVLGDCRDAYLANPCDRDGIWAGMRGHDLLAASRTSRADRNTPAGPTRAHGQPADRRPGAEREGRSR